MGGAASTTSVDRALASVCSDLSHITESSAPNPAVFRPQKSVRFATRARRVRKHALSVDMEDPARTALTVYSNADGSLPPHMHLKQVRRGNLTDAYELCRQPTSSRKSSEEPVVLGKGSTASVLAGVRLCDGALVAIKQMLLGPNIDAALAELRALERTDHPHIARLFDAVVSPGGAAIALVLEHLDGGSLAELVEASGALPEAHVARLLQQLLLAVHYLHDKGIVHRDVRLENVLLASEEPEADAVLTDFGSAHELAHKGEVMTGCPKVTYATAPEALKGSYSAAVDLWAVGACAFQLLTGRRHFEARRDKDMRAHVAAGTVKWRYARFQRLSTGAQDFVLRLLQLAPEQRMSAAQALQHPWLAAATQQEPPLCAAAQDARTAMAAAALHDGVVRLSTLPRLQQVAAFVVAHDLPRALLPPAVRAAYDALDPNCTGRVVADALPLPESCCDEVCKVLDPCKRGFIESTAVFAAFLDPSAMAAERALLRSVFKRLSFGRSLLTEQRLRVFLGSAFNRRDAVSMLRDVRLSQGRLSDNEGAAGLDFATFAAYFAAGDPASTSDASFKSDRVEEPLCDSFNRGRADYFSGKASMWIL